MQNPKEVERKVSHKRDAESLDILATSPTVPSIKPKAEQKEEIKISEEETKDSKPEKEKPKHQASIETVHAINDSLFTMQDIAKYVRNPAIPNDKRGQYCIQLNMAVMGEIARQVVRMIDANDEYMPRCCKEIPWKKLIELRNYCTHRAHLQDLEQLNKAIRKDIPALENMAASMRSLIEKIQHEKKEHEKEPLKLVAIDEYLNAIKEIEKKKKEEKSKDELLKNENIHKLSKQVKGLKAIVDELNNIQDFLKTGKDEVTLYAVQMAIVRMGLVVSDRLDEDFQNKHLLQINIPERLPITWKSLVKSRERTIHRNYKMDSESTMREAIALQGAFHFFKKLYEQQNANLMKLKTEFHQKQQAERINLSQPTTLTEERKPIKISFSLPKAQSKIKAPGFVNPFMQPLPPASGTILPKHSSTSDVKEEERPPSLSPNPGRKK